MTESLRDFYPEIEPFATGFLPVSKVHSLYYEESGNVNGLPVVYLHGGPGGGTSPDDRRYFNPQAYRIIVFDQRGAGKSTPSASLIDNTTWHLVEDIEKLRIHLKIDKWVVFGGSWGSTLALSYAVKHAERLKALILRGIFTLRKSEVDWFYQKGASHIFPDMWDGYVAPIPEAERDNFIQAYYKRLTGSDIAQQLQCAKAWSLWECATSKLHVDPEMLARVESDEWAVAFARIECHYFINNGFFENDGWLLEQATKIKNIPAVIVQGRYDVVCPATTAWELHKKTGWPLHLIADAGHSAKEKGIRSELVKAADAFASMGK